MGSCAPVSQEVHYPYTFLYLRLFILDFVPFIYLQV